MTWTGASCDPDVLEYDSQDSLIEPEKKFATQMLTAQNSTPTNPPLDPIDVKPNVMEVDPPVSPPPQKPPAKPMPALASADAYLRQLRLREIIKSPVRFGDEYSQLGS